MNQKQYLISLVDELSRYKKESNPESVLISTSSGLFMGNVFFPGPDEEINDSDTPSINAIKVLFSAMRSKDSLVKNQEIQFIPLINVTHFGPTGQIKMPFIIIFLDEIVGISCGSIG